MTNWENASIFVRVALCVSAVRAVEVPESVCLRSTCSHLTEIGFYKDRETRGEGYHAKCQGLCGSNADVLHLIN